MTERAEDAYLNINFSSRVDTQNVCLEKRDELTPAAGAPTGWASCQGVLCIHLNSFKSGSEIFQEIKQ